MRSKYSHALRLSVIAPLLLCVSAVLRAEVTWFPLGPFGGDARSFATDPRDAKHIYLGTATGWVYDTHDGGATWKRVAQIAHRDDLVIDHILPDATDPQRLIVAAWTADHPDGGLWISNDGGNNWYSQAEMHGQAVLALARSITNTNEIVAGTLRGVFRSMDNGIHWKQISPESSTELHEVESIAIDPSNPNVIYAGTWHLPWKTTDGGEHWTSIHEGIIDDSDVFSIIVDPSNPKVVYASACSGIYKSATGAEPNPRDEGKRFDKIQGIPTTARRTRKLAQDPKHLNTVYAGTTEGLYRTLDAGEHWSRITGPDLIVNDVYIDPENPDHVLLATDRGGVLSSSNAGESFRNSNAGFSARQIIAYASDPHNASRLYVGVVNDKETGGVFTSNDAGVSWQQQSTGLGGRDIFSLAATQDGVILAGTNHGIFRLSDGTWSDSGVLHSSSEKTHGPVIVSPASDAAPAPTPPPAIAPVKAKTAVKGKARTPAKVAKKLAGPTKSEPVEHLDELIYTIAPEINSIYAGTSNGLLRGDAFGNGWTRVSSLKLDEVRFVALNGHTLLAASLKEMQVSANGGQTWKPVALPQPFTQISTLAVDNEKTIWVGGREGLFRSSDLGESWQPTTGLLLNDVDSIYFDAAANRLLVTTAQSNFVFAVHLPDYKVNYWNSGWKLRFARPVGDHLIAATLFDGIVVQPLMVDSAVAPTKLSGPNPAPSVATATSPTAAAETTTKQ